jgi:3-phenylpropionate/trans-cinnamate dioxygenase ferredoxin reductase component
MSRRVVIVGAGQAGTQCALSLRELGYADEITLIGDEPELPYQRPPLSKAFLVGQLPEAALRIRTAEVLQSQRIGVLTGCRVEAIEREARRVRLGDGARLEYSHLVLATGVENRTLRVPGVDEVAVSGLRTVADARALRTLLETARRVVVVGGGFIGLEFAAVARKLGLQVQVVEWEPRLMQRALAPRLSAYFEALHARHGVQLRLNDRVGALERASSGGGCVVQLVSGDRVPADAVVAGIGVVPRVGLAQGAGLEVQDGIVVNESLCTADPAIWAIGDVARFPSPWSVTHQRLRLESVQNAVDQGRHVAAAIIRGASRYEAVPWFWSDQFAAKLQIAGLTQGADEVLLRGDPKAGSFTAFCFKADRLLGAESVNRPADHLAVRKILAASVDLTPGMVADEAFDLKQYAKEAATAPYASG